MCKGLGIDLCEIARMEALLCDDRFLARWFSPEEAAYIRARKAGAAQSMAGIFAAKEAVLKALGTGLALPLTDVTVVHDASGQPQVVLLGKAASFVASRGGALRISITHEAGMAAAVAIWDE